MEDQEQSCTMENRSFLRLTGIKKVSSSMEGKVDLETTLGDMIVEGTDLHICHLDLSKGELHVGGHINSIYYPEPVLKNNGSKTKSRKSTFKFGK